MTSAIGNRDLLFVVVDAREFDALADRVAKLEKEREEARAAILKATTPNPQAQSDD